MKIFNIEELMKEKDFVLLETKSTNTVKIFCNPTKILRADSFSAVDSTLREWDKLSSNYWTAGFFSYELGYAFTEKIEIDESARNFPLIWLGIYDHVKELSASSFFKGQKDLETKLSPKPCVKKDEYINSVKRIKALIQAGDTYQVNFTFKQKFDTDLSAVELYYNLRSNQPTDYSSLISAGDIPIISFSPELFFEKKKGSITTKPMKGTAARANWHSADILRREWLSKDEKNRAENIMIVDLLRNDIGRICKHGSVKATDLFEVETHPTLHQMISTVTGELRKDISYKDIFKAIFPCGSVTGAPKIRTMQIIRDLEKCDRNVYCGAIGYTSPEKNGVFSVPIRTMYKEKNSEAWSYHSGGGLVWDSNADEEWEECLTKTAFLSHKSSVNFGILETILFENNIFIFKDKHIERMKGTAQYFDYPFDDDLIHNVLAKCSKEAAAQKCIFRFVLNSDGKISYTQRAYIDNECQDVLISKQTVNSQSPFFYHKTTYRPWYKQAEEMIKEKVCYDVLFFNEKGELTEGAISNIFLELNGELFTPPVKSGLLPGILRNDLLLKEKCAEKQLYKDDLIKADRIFCGNSVRGLKEVFLKP